jgi:hypothetical protein
MTDRAKAIRRNRQAYGLPPLQPSDLAARATKRLPAVPGPSPKDPTAATPKHPRPAARLGEFAHLFKPPKEIVLVAGIPAVAAGARLPGERRQKRKRR